MSDVTTGADASTRPPLERTRRHRGHGGRANLRVAEVGDMTGLTSASAGDVLRGLQRRAGSS